MRICVLRAGLAYKEKCLTIFLKLGVVIMKKYQLFASGYTAGQPREGVALFELEGTEIRKVWGWKGMTNPSYILPVGNCLYGVEEQPGQASVIKLPLEPLGGKMQRFLVPGSGLCHLSCQGERLYAAGYAGGTLTGLKGENGEVCAFYQHQGHSANPVRQEKAHVHSSLPSPDGSELLVADLGLDRLFRYSIGKNGGLALNPAEPWVSIPPGQGPRHFAFHPRGQWLYLVNELEKTLYGFQYRGTEEKIQLFGEYDISQPKTEGSLAADVHFTPDGSWLYVSVRGTDRIFCFHCQENGQLEVAGDFSSGGQGPRSFHISPDGQFLAAANQVSGNIVVFPLNQATGALEEKTAEFSFPEVSCVKFWGTSV